MKDNKGFTIIELIVVIVILGVLILLAMPSLLGYTEKARVAHIKNDIKAYENAIEIERIHNDISIGNWREVDSSILEEHKENGTLYNKRGKVEESSVFDDEYFLIEDNLVKSKLEGDFIMRKDGKVYYNENPTEVNANACPKYTMAQDEDFTFTKENSSWETYEFNGDTGYFKYTGSDECVEIPHTIKGVHMTSYRGMFEGAEGIKGVKSTSKNIESMSYMFSDANLPDLDISQLDISSTAKFAWMFLDGNFENASFDFTGLKSAEIEMQGTFSNSVIKNFDMNNIELKSLIAPVIFNGTKANNVNMSNMKIEESIVFPSSFLYAEVSNITLKDSSFGDRGDFNGAFYGVKADSVDLSNITANKGSMNGMFSLAEVKSINMENTKIDEGYLNTLFEKLVAEYVNINNSSFYKSELNGMFKDASIDVIDAKKLMAQESEMNTAFENLMTNKINMENGIFKSANMNGLFFNTSAIKLNMENGQFDSAQLNGAFSNAKINEVNMKNGQFDSAQLNTAFSESIVNKINMKNGDFRNAEMNSIFQVEEASEINVSGAEGIGLDEHSLVGNSANKIELIIW